MKKTREQMKKELRERSDEIIERLLNWHETHNAPDLTQIEEIVLELRKELGQAFAASLVESQERTDPVRAVCPSCGQEMRNKGRKRKIVESRVGGLELERGYYHCPECGAGIFPPGRPVEGDRETTE
jgi:uncharacterized protein with PIN domain